MIFGNMSLVIGILVLFLALALLLLVVRKRRAAGAGASGMPDETEPAFLSAETPLEEAAPAAPAANVRPAVVEAGGGETEHVRPLLDFPADAPINQDRSAAEAAGSESLLTGEPALFWDNVPESHHGAPSELEPIEAAPALDFSGQGPAIVAAGAAAASTLPVGNADPVPGSLDQPAWYTADSNMPAWDDPTGPIEPAPPLDEDTPTHFGCEPGPQNGNGNRAVSSSAETTVADESGSDGALAPVAEEESIASTPTGPFTAGFVPTPVGDPVARLVDGLMEGQGDLTPEELRRLELYRPERVLAYTEQVTESVSGRGKESKRSRLTRIRRYAESMQIEAEPEPRLTVQPLRQSVGMPSGPEANEDTAGPSTPAPAGIAAAAVVSGIAPTMRETYRPNADAPGAGGGDVIPPVAPAIVGMGSAETDWRPRTDAPLDPELSLFPDETEPHAAETFAAEPPVEKSSLDSDPVVPIEVIPMNEPFATDELYDTPVVADNAPAREAGPAEDGPPVMDDAPILDAQLDPNDVFGGAPSTTDPDVSARPQVEAVLALPPEQREQALFDLNADELARTFTTVEDPDLKRSAVDKLEERGTGAALSALQKCLEDPDPALQLYALEAAERLLSRS